MSRRGQAVPETREIELLELGVSLDRVDELSERVSGLRNLGAEREIERRGFWRIERDFQRRRSEPNVVVSRHLLFGDFEG